MEPHGGTFQRLATNGVAWNVFRSAPVLAHDGRAIQRIATTALFGGFSVQLRSQISTWSLEGSLHSPFRASTIRAPRGIRVRGGGRGNPPLLLIRGPPLPLSLVLCPGLINTGGRGKYKELEATASFQRRPLLTGGVENESP